MLLYDKPAEVARIKSSAKQIDQKLRRMQVKINAFLVSRGIQNWIIVSGESYPENLCVNLHLHNNNWDMKNLGHPDIEIEPISHENKLMFEFIRDDKTQDCDTDHPNYVEHHCWTDDSCPTRSQYSNISIGIFNDTDDTLLDAILEVVKQNYDWFEVECDKEAVLAYEVMSCNDLTNAE